MPYDSLPLRNLTFSQNKQSSNYSTYVHVIVFTCQCLDHRKYLERFRNSKNDIILKISKNKSTNDLSFSHRLHSVKDKDSIFYFILRNYIGLQSMKKTNRIAMKALPFVRFQQRTLTEE